MSSPVIKLNKSIVVVLSSQTVTLPSVPAFTEVTRVTVSESVNGTTQPVAANVYSTPSIHTAPPVLVNVNRLVDTPVVNVVCSKIS